MELPEDEREEELTTIAAIYPELVVDGGTAYAASIDLPVAPYSPLVVHFPAAPPPSPPHSDDGHPKLHSPVPDLHETHKLQHLPPLRLRAVLPQGYPADEAPHVTLSTTPDWLPATKLQELERECGRLWEDFGRCQILFSYIDFLQQAAERAFDLDVDGLSLAHALKPALLDHDTTTKKRIFDSGTFDCGICLEPKKGSACHRMHRCGHVFCLPCLQDFYTNCIAEGDVQRVRCLDPTCGDDGEAKPPGQRKRKRRSDKTLHPKELLAMAMQEQTVRRYVDMKRKKALEADKTTVYCPRAWCQAPARSKKYPPIPADLSQYPESDSGSETDSEATVRPVDSKPAPSDRLAVCSNKKCMLAFCKTCFAGWHGDYARCWPRNPAELSEEEKASYDYIRLHTSPCPTCSSPTQKTMGCNHMSCFQCGTHFCYLCGAWLDGENPYMHFNRGNSSCYQRLWELEEGDEGEGAVRFEGPRRWEAEARAVAEAADREEAEQLQREEDERAARALAEQLEPADVPDVDPNRAAEPRRQQGPPRREAGGREGRGRGGRPVAAEGRAQQNPQQMDAAAAAAFRRFIALAVRDEEDGWDSDELDGDGDEDWEIRAR